LRWQSQDFENGVVMEAEVDHQDAKTVVVGTRFPHTQGTETVQLPGKRFYPKVACFDRFIGATVCESFRL